MSTPAEHTPDDAGLSALVTSSGASGTVEIRCPFDQTLVGSLPVSSGSDVQQAVAAARVAQQGWKSWSVQDRAAVIIRFRELVLDRTDDLLDSVQSETGKARISGVEEIADITLWSSYLARKGPGVLRPRRRGTAFPLISSATEHRVPVGVVGVITPWNYPLTLPVTDSLPALLAGNAVVLKPDEQTSHTALRVLALLHEAGLPRDVMQVVVGPGEQTGAAVVDHCDYVMFTGSSATGQQVATRCGERLIGFSGELGGKNPMLVLDDADVPRAAKTAAQACFSNAGQLCVSIERIYVADAVWDQFTRAFVRRTRQLTLAPGLIWESDVGSLIGPDQLATVSRHVDDALSKGANALTGARPRPDLGPYFYEPTILTGVTEDMLAYREETFGPVVSLYRVADDAQAVAAANDSPYGLNASVFSRHRGQDVATALRSGGVNINDGFAASWIAMDAPMGGVGRSGVGRRHGSEGILKYTEAQTVAVQRVASAARPRGVPHAQWAQMMLRGINVLKRQR